MYASRLFAFVVVAAIALPQFASAADLPRMTSKAPVMVPVTGWTGWYAGLNAGYGWGNEAVAVTGDEFLMAIGIPNGVVPASIAKNPGGFIAGGQIGYNRQINQWVLGVEADLQWSDIKRRQSIATAVPGGFPPFLTRDEQKLEWLGTLRGRVGYVLAPQWLIYGTAGLAYGGVSLSGYSALNHAVFPICTGSYCGAGSTSSTRVGWTAGAGVEYALTRPWSLKAEYLYYDLGGVSLYMPDLLNRVPLTFQVHSVDFAGHVVRGGVNYRFGG